MSNLQEMYSKTVKDIQTEWHMLGAAGPRTMGEVQCEALVRVLPEYINEMLNAKGNKNDTKGSSNKGERDTADSTQGSVGEHDSRQIGFASIEASFDAGNKRPRKRSDKGTGSGN